MSKYMFNEGVVWEDRRLGSYIIPYIIFFVIFAIPAVLVWFAARLLPILPFALPFTAEQFTLTTEIVVCAVCAVIALLILLIGIRNTKVPQLIMTPRRLCLVKGDRKYTEVRFNKIDAVSIRGRKIAVYAGGRRCIRFGPIANPYATRNAIVGLIDFDLRPTEDDTLTFDEAEPIDKDGDVFDADIQ